MPTVDGSAPRRRTFYTRVPAVAQGATLQTTIAEMPFAGRVVRATYIPDAGIAGANTSFRRLDLVNKGLTGAGTTISNRLDFVAGTNATAFAGSTVPVNGAASNQVVAAGDTLTLNSQFVSSGIADPGGLFVVEVSNDA